MGPYRPTAPSLLLISNTRLPLGDVVEDYLIADVALTFGDTYLYVPDATATQFTGLRALVTLRMSKGRKSDSRLRIDSSHVVQDGTIHPVVLASASMYSSRKERSFDSTFLQVELGRAFLIFSLSRTFPML